MTLPLVVITCVISYLCFQNEALFNKLAHHPFSERHKGQYYRLLSSGFVHGSLGHLAINMFVLYQFGAIVEIYFNQMFGTNMSPIIFVGFYISAIIVANIGTYLKHGNHQGFRSVGASGVTSALVFIYSFLDPWQMFLFPPIPAILFAVLYVGYSTWASKKDRDNIDHLAHLYGGLYGLLFIVIAYPESLDIFFNRLMSGW